MRPLYVVIPFALILAQPARAADGQACADREQAYRDMKKDDFSALDAACQSEISAAANPPADKVCFKDGLNDDASVAKVVAGDGTMGGTGMSNGYKASYFANQTQKNNCDYYYNRVSNGCAGAKPTSLLNALDQYSKCSEYRMAMSVDGAKAAGATATNSASKYEQHADALGLVKGCYVAACMLSGMNGGPTVENNFIRTNSPPAITDAETTEFKQPTIQQIRAPASGM